MISARELKEISSLKKKKYRRLYSKFLIEGFHLIDECLKSPYRPERIIVSEEADISPHSEIFSKIKALNIKYDYLPVSRFRAISDTENSQGIVAVMGYLKTSKRIYGDIVVAADRISDPGNLGTIIRTAHWFGVKTVIIGAGSVDLYNPKLIRATQGSVFHVNIIVNADLVYYTGKLYKNGFTVVLLMSDSDSCIHEYKKPGKCVLIVGNESEGISPKICSPVYDKIKIKGYSECESLNAAVSFGIALYEFTKPA